MSLGPLMIDLRGASLSADEADWLAEPAVGGVILFTRNFVDLDQLRELIAAIRAVREPELLIAVDQEGGRVQRFREPFTRLPAMRTIGHLYDAQPERALRAAREIGWLLAAELRSLDIDLSFAPVVDIDRGLADVIGDRAFHRESDVVARLAIESTAGMKDAGMAAVAKHFPTHAGAIADSHTSMAVDNRDFTALLDDIDPYRRLIAAGLHGIMAAHVRFPRADSAPASFSSWWLRDQLRGELGFHGAVFSDDLAMLGAAVAPSAAERAVIALEAGCDVVLLCNSPADVPETIERLSGWVHPASQLRLMRLRGERHTEWATLRASQRWQAARQLVDGLLAQPTLELEG